MTSELPFMVPPGEAAIVTKANMTDFELLVPGHLKDGHIMPRSLLFLTACFLRAGDDQDFVDEQVAWFESLVDEVS